MTTVQPGTFVMGAAEGDGRQLDDETPRHAVTLTRAFRIGATEVPQSLYVAVVGENPSDFIGADRPVESVSWLDAIVFCNVLSELEGLDQAYRVSEESVGWDTSATGFRLPTEAEWEYAARAGEATPYPGSARADEVAWYVDTSRRRTHPVGQLLPNAWDLHDMAGNVYEWVWDRYGAYSFDDAQDPAGPDRGDHRVFRGGSWGGTPAYLRVTARGHGAAHLQRRGLGFRVARNVDPVMVLRPSSRETRAYAAITIAANITSHTTPRKCQ